MVPPPRWGVVSRFGVCQDATKIPVSLGPLPGVSFGKSADGRYSAQRSVLSLVAGAEASKRTSSELMPTAGSYRDLRQHDGSVVSLVRGRPAAAVAIAVRSHDADVVRRKVIGSAWHPWFARLSAGDRRHAARIAGAVERSVSSSMGAPSELLRFMPRGAG